MLEFELRLPVFKWLAHQESPFRYEVTVPWGRADIVALAHIGSSNFLTPKVMEGLTVPIRAKILATVINSGERGITIASLVKTFKYFYERSELLAAINFLAERGLLEIGAKITSPKMRSRPKLLAIELKLSNYKQVLFQALNNSAFSSYNYVALPVNAAQKLISTHHENLNNHGIGVLGIDGNSCIEIMPPFEVKPHDTCLEIQMLSRLIRLNPPQAHLASKTLRHERPCSSPQSQLAA